MGYEIKVWSTSNKVSETPTSGANMTTGFSAGSLIKAAEINAAIRASSIGSYSFLKMLSKWSSDYGVQYSEPATNMGDSAITTLLTQTDAVMTAKIARTKSNDSAHADAAQTAVDLSKPGTGVLYQSGQSQTETVEDPERHDVAYAFCFDQGEGPLWKETTDMHCGEANKLHTARNINVRSGLFSGTAVAFDGSSNIVLTLPDTIAADTIGSAAKLNHNVSFRLSSGLTTKHYGQTVSYDLSGNQATFELPNVINASLGNESALYGDYHGRSTLQPYASVLENGQINAILGSKLSSVDGLWMINMVCSIAEYDGTESNSATVSLMAKCKIVDGKCSCDILNGPQLVTLVSDARGGPFIYGAKINGVQNSDDYAKITISQLLPIYPNIDLSNARFNVHYIESFRIGSGI